MFQKIITIGIIIVSLALTTGCDRKDACLDQGGRFHEATQQCEQ